MEEEKRKKGPWLNILLFVVTVLSTFFVGVILSLNFKYAELAAQGTQLDLKASIRSDPQLILLGFIYAAVLICILLGHELGHYLTCRYYQINATLPYFIPAPTLIGTLGAFIKIKSPITRKQQLFDVGIAGPLLGFILSLPALFYGLSLSKVIPSLPREESLIFGEPLLFKIIGNILFRDIPSGNDIFLHPIAFAGWVGTLVTAFNLFPIGQLDGGHISYALIGSKSKYLARLFLVVFLVMGILFWIGWFVWALIILFLGLKHPRVIDEEAPLGLPRKIMGFMAIVIFIFSFSPAPIKGYNLFDLLKQIRF